MNSSNKAVLGVKSQRFLFTNFEVTLLGDYPRYVYGPNFKSVDGINPKSGHDSKFINPTI